MGEQQQQQRDKIFTRDFSLVVALNFILFLAFQMFPSALPVYAASIGTPSSLLGLITGALTISALVARPLAGMAADRYGRKGVLMGGLAVMLICTAAYAFCPPFALVVIIRFIQGLGWGCCSTATSTIASDTLPRSRFGEGMGYFGLSVSVAIAIGPALGLTLVNTYGITFLSVLGSVLLVVTLVVGVITKTITITPSATKRKVSLIERGAVIPALLMGLLTCMYGAIVTFLALTAAERGVGSAAGFFVCYAVAALVSRPLSGRFIDKNGFKLATVAGTCMMLLGMVVIVFAGNFVLLLVAGAIFGFGQGIVQTTLQTQAVVQSPRDRVGAANATFMVGFDGGIGLGALLGGLLVGFFGYTGMFAAMCALPIIALAILFATSARPA